MKYVVLGSCDPGYQSRLDRQVRELELQDVVRFLEYVPDAMLHGFLLRADVCINLRFPVTEGASASAIETMWYGKAMIVTDTGHFGELPDDCACKISLQDEQRDLRAALTMLLDEEPVRRAFGEAARVHVGRYHTADYYAAQFIDFAQEVSAAKPFERLADQVGRELRAIGTRPDMSVLGSVVDHYGKLFGDVA